MGVLSPSGIKAILLTKKNNFNPATGTPTGVYALGLRANGTFTAEENGPVDYRGRHIRNDVTFKVSADSYQVDMDELYNKFIAIYTADNGCDAQIVLLEKWGSGTFKAFNFAGSADAEMGIEWEYTIGNDGRLMKVMLENSLPYDDAVTLIGGSVNASEHHTWLNSNGYGKAGNLFNKLAITAFIKFESPSGTALFTKDEIISWKLTLKTKSSQKSAYGRAFIDFITAELEIVGRNVSLTQGTSKVYELFNKDNGGASIVVDVRTSPSITDRYSFSGGSLNLKNAFQFGEGNTNLKAVFAGDIALGDITYSSGSISTLTINAG